MSSFFTSCFTQIFDGALSEDIQEFNTNIIPIGISPNAQYETIFFKKEKHL